MPEDIGSIELFMGPSPIGAPDDLEQTIIAFIEGATKTLDVAVQELESDSIARALIAAEQRGVKVRLVLEGAYLTEKHKATDPFVAVGDNELNRTIHAAILRTPIEVYTDLNPNIFHQKFMIRDVAGTSSRRAVLTGSTNFTPTGVGVNLNNLVILHSKRACDIYQAEFDEVLSGTFGPLKRREDKVANSFQLAGIRVKILFAPDDSPELELMRLMLQARDRVDFAMFTFSGSSGIDDTLFALQKAGIFVRGVFDNKQGGQDWAPTQGLADAGCEIYRARGAGLGKLHHKMAVIDEQVVVVGSFNFTGPANLLNDENIVILGDVFENRPNSVARQTRLGAYAMNEIDRIIQVHGHQVMPSP